MKKVSILMFFVLMTSWASAQVSTPAASPSTTLIQKFALSEVTVNYSRPGMKGRKVFGDLVAFGSVWRTGANNATTLAFNDPVMVEGHEVPAGKYSLYTIPEEDKWTIILNKQFSWGTQYDEGQDFLRFEVSPETSPVVYETFTIEFGNFTTNGTVMALKWENTVVNIGITMDVDQKIVGQINRFMEDPTRGLAGTYYQSAAYYYETDKDLEKALEWVNKSLEYNPDPYWVLRLKSQIQAGLNQYKAAIETAKKSRDMAEKAGNADYVRLNEKAISEWKEML